MSRVRRRVPEARIVRGIQPDSRPEKAISAEFRGLFREGGARLRPAGEARHDPRVLLGARFVPKFKVELFDTVYFLTDYRFDDDINFMIAYVALTGESRRVRDVYPRIFYKDSSLVWRVATHVIRTEDDNWMGKGEVRWEKRPDGEFLCSAEETTNLPFEIQGALDAISERKHPFRDARAVPLVLRGAPDGRMEPYSDFSGPRRRARERFHLNHDRPVATFARKNDPSSLRFAPGFEPDLKRGVIEVTTTKSRIYGGRVDKYRVSSKNALIQYQFVHSPKHLWLNPPQPLSPELTTYGNRTLDVLADEYLFVPAYEFHYVDETFETPEVYSQIPPGFAGEASDVDPSRANAMPWIEKLPVIRDFRRKVLGAGRR